MFSISWWLSDFAMDSSTAQGRVHWTPCLTTCICFGVSGLGISGVCGFLQERAHKHALQRVIRADAFALEHKRVNEWDLSDAMATFANQYRQELRYILHIAICPQTSLTQKQQHHCHFGKAYDKGSGILSCHLLFSVLLVSCKSSLARSICTVNTKCWSSSLDTAARANTLAMMMLCTI